MKFKQPLTLDEMIEHLKTNKNVIFNECSEEQAKEFLLKYNYINVVTPAKHLFHKGKDENGNHIYNRKIDFQEYINAYEKERKVYPVLNNKILYFENIFNSVLSYHVLIYYNLNDSENFSSFFDKLLDNSLKIGDFYQELVTSTIIDFKKDINESSNPYLFLDRLSMSNLLCVFISLNREIQKDIVDNLKSFDCNLNTEDVYTFYDRANICREIRNLISHNNSLSIYKVYNKKGEHKSKSRRKRIDNIISIIDKINYELNV